MGGGGGAIDTESQWRKGQEGRQSEHQRRRKRQSPSVTKKDSSGSNPTLKQTTVNTDTLQELGACTHLTKAQLSTILED